MKVPEPRKLKSGTWFLQMRLGGESVPVSAATRTECIRQAEKIPLGLQTCAPSAFGGQRVRCSQAANLLSKK